VSHRYSLPREVLVEQRVSFITLAVSDVRRSRDFYVDGLGWKPIFEADDVLMFPVGEHLILSLWRVDGFAAEVGHAPAPGVAPVALAHNVPSESGVDEVLALAESLGAEVSVGTRREWGGYSGYFVDPDGFRWEIAMNPGFTGDYVLP
jgi:catechol 2,3-dioxygenase-like lactoylglutathione lyase family enzyme